MVKLKHPTGDFANFGKRVNARLVQAEVPRPGIGTGIEETSQRSGVEIQGAKMSSFVPVTVKAGIGQIFRNRNAAMLDTDDVIHFTTVVNIGFVNQAVLAEVIRPF
jgi:hypothetical protein